LDYNQKEKPVLGTPKPLATTAHTRVKEKIWLPEKTMNLHKVKPEW